MRLNTDKSIALVLSGQIDKSKWPQWLKEVKSAKICGVYFEKNEDKSNEEKDTRKIKEKSIHHSTQYKYQN